MNKILRLLLPFSALLPVNVAFADTLFLANGNSLEGVVLWETPERLEFQFAHAGSITFGRDEVVSVLRADAAGRDGLLKAWSAGYEAFLAELKFQEEFTKSQRARGLIHDGQDWVTKDEFAARTEREKVLAEAEAKAAAARKEAAPAAPQVVYVVTPVRESVVAIGPPVIESFPTLDSVGRPTGYVTRRKHPRREDKREHPDKPRDWRYQTAWERAQTAHWNFMSVKR